MKKSVISLLLPLAGIVALGSFGFAQNNDQKAEREKQIATAAPEKAYATPAQKGKLLVFSVTNGFRHQSIETGKVALRILGEKTGAYDVVISDDLSHFEPENIKNFKAICFLNTTGEVFSPSKKALEGMSDSDKRKAGRKTRKLQKSLMKFIKDGGGFVGIHSATDTFYKWPEYGEMMNGYFWGHPWTAGTDVSIKVEPDQVSHPLVAMFEGENLNFKEEIYQLKDPYDSKKVNMLLRLDTEKSNMDVKGIHRTDNDFGVAWNRNWGKGRVFYCSLGHNHHIYSNEKVLKHYLAGIQWAMGDYNIKKAMDPDGDSKLEIKAKAGR